MTSSSHAKEYYRQSDYYASSPGEWLGRGAEILGLEGPAQIKDFDLLCDNIDPRDGSLLRPNAKDGGRIGIDLTFNSTKSVGIARELGGVGNTGDLRIEDAHREAVRYTMGFIENDMQTRVRVGGADHDRVTGNMVAYRVTHRDTRISAEDQMPDMSLHDHVFVFNATYDDVEGKWKAAQVGAIKHDAPYYEALYHNRLASNLRELGYGIRRKDKAFEIAGISDDLVKKFSRRREHIKAVAAKLGITSAAGFDKLGATTRLGKAKEMTDDLNDYFASRLTAAERKSLTGLIGQKSFVSDQTKAVAYAIEHLFERQSVVEERKLYEVAIRHGIGSVTLESVQAEALGQGVLLKDSQATTKAVLAEESRLIDFARESKGTMRPLSERAAAIAGHLTSLSAEQKAMVSHVLGSTDKIVMVIGDAGAGKTHAIKSAFAHIDCPVEMLAPSAEASRGVLRREGFSNADTVASFLLSEERQDKVKNGVIWVDEAALLSIRDLTKLVCIAQDQNARIVLQGDPKQHRSVVRHGNMMNVLQEFAGLPVGRLKEIWRQKHDGFKAIVASIAEGKHVKAFDRLADLGWVNKVDSNELLVEDYLEALRTKKPKQTDQDRVAVVVPSHAEGEAITADLRKRLQDEGMLAKDERTFERLVAQNWSVAERGDLHRYQGDEVLHFHVRSGSFKAGERIHVTDWKLGDHFSSPLHFSVYREAEIALAAGDLVRFTARGKSVDGHRLDNGSIYRLKGFDRHGNLQLANGWTVSKHCGHLTHGYTSTSHAVQGKTVDRVLIAMGSESSGALSSEQFYVSVSRGREFAKIYSDLSREELKQAIQKKDTRQSATELMQPKKTPTAKRRSFDGMKSLLKKARERLNELQKALSAKTKHHSHNKEREHAGIER